MSERLTPSDIVTQIMTMHWDMAACECWICKAGRDAGLFPSSAFETRPNDRAYVEEPR